MLPQSAPSGNGSCAYSAKLLARTKQRFSGLSHMRQCGDDVLRMLVTGGPPVRGGGGMPQRILVSARPVSVSSDVINPALLGLSLND